MVPLILGNPHIGIHVGPDCFYYVDARTEKCLATVRNVAHANLVCLSGISGTHGPTRPGSYGTFKDFKVEPWVLPLGFPRGTSGNTFGQN